MEKVLVKCNINGKSVETYVDPRASLTDLLRNDFRLTSVKKGCEVGECGACTVLIGGEPYNACIYLAVWADGQEIRTLEGLTGDDGGITPLQQAFIDEYAFQCGYCTPGIIMTSRALFNHNPHPTREEIAEALSGNYCRCISHYHVLDALEKLSKKGVEE